MSLLYPRIMITLANRIISYFKKAENLNLLLIRLVLAYGFYMPAMMKVKNVSGISSWFMSMNIPFPEISAYLATGTEVLGVVLLAIGFGTRWISIPLIFTMIVAIITVHFSNGFQAAENGFEIPLYYILFLMIMISRGAGKFSLDYLIWGRGKH